MATKPVVDPHEPKMGREVRPMARAIPAADLRYDGSGHELVSPLPMAPPVGYKKTPSLSDQIREMVRSERLAQAAAEQGFETFEEADDFEIGDFDPSSPYEIDFDPVPEPAPAQPAPTVPEAPAESQGSQGPEGEAKP